MAQIDLTALEAEAVAEEKAAGEWAFCGVLD
jgi:hypothetical protein